MNVQVSRLAHGLLLGLILSATPGCGDRDRTEGFAPDGSPHFAERWEVLENDCTCPGLTLFFNLDAYFELQTSDGPSDYKMCWVEGPHHPDLVRCYEADIQMNYITIDVWDAGCARTPCDGTFSEDGTSIAASCREAFGDTCSLTLAVVGE